MSLIDFILNLAGLLLWLSWRSLRFDPLARASAATLVGTLRRAEPQRWKGWQFLAGLLALLLARALFYWQIGSAASWTPRLDLGVVVLNLRSSFLRIDYLRTALFYSLLSQGRMLLLFYFWILALTVINRRSADTEPIQKLLRLHLSRLAHWPWPLQAILPFLFAAGLWLALHPLLVRTGVLLPVNSKWHLLGQAFLVGSALYFSLKYVLPVFLLLHLLASYVYLGSSPLWDFVAATAGNLLAPLRGLPLRLGRWDLAPVVGTALVLLLLHWLPELFQYLLARHNLTLWPQ